MSITWQRISEAGILSSTLSDFVSQPRRGRRSVSIPRRLGVRPVSIAAADFHGSAGFFLRVGIIGAATLCLFGLLALRLWSLQIVRGPHFALAAQRQTFRLIDLPAPRGQIVDAQGNVLAGTSGGLAVSVDSAVLGLIDQHGRWWPTHQGRQLLNRLGYLASASPRLMILSLIHI